MVVSELGTSRDTDDKDIEAWIKREIEAVSEEIASDAWCGQPVEYGTATGRFFAPTGRKLLLYHPIHDVVSLESADSAFDDWGAVAAEDYQLVNDNGLYFIEIRNPSPNRLYRVVVNCGYWPPEAEGAQPEGVDDMPKPLQAVALDMIAWRYEQAHMGRRNIKNESQGDQQLTTSYVSIEEKQRQWRRGLAPYRARMTL